MTSVINALRMRRTWGVKEWMVPAEYGNGWLMQSRDLDAAIIVTWGDFDGQEWIHASMTRVEHVPTYDDLSILHRSVWGASGWSYLLFVPASEHINIHPHALHLWGRLDGARVLPNFGQMGTI